MEWSFSFNSQMIRNQVQLSEDVSQRFDGLESQLQTLINGQQLIIGAINRTLKKDKRRSVRKPPEQKQLGQKNKEPSNSDVSRILHLPEALQRNICKFTENILFKSSSIPDDLISTECLSEDECSVITSKPSQKDQTRLLIRKIKARGPEVTEKFLDIIRKDHPELYDNVYKTLDEIARKYKDKPECAICVMQYTVDLKDIADYLWEQNIITVDIYGDIIESESLHRIRPMIWSSIINSLNNINDIGEAKAILIKALTPKYEHIVKYINKNPDRPSLSCWCCRKSRRVRPRPLVSEFGSQTDVSTTSAKLPKVIDDNNVSDDSQSVISSQGLPSSDLLSFEWPEAYENISVPQRKIQSTFVDSTTAPTNELTAENENVQRLSECFVPQAELLENDVQCVETKYVSSTSIKDASANITDDETKDRQELQHSISTVSTSSTICAVHSLSSLGAADDTASIDEIQSLLQSEIKEDENISVLHDETDSVKFQDPNDETISTKESKADGTVKEIQNDLTTDIGDEKKDHAKGKATKDIEETMYTRKDSDGGQAINKEKSRDEEEMDVIEVAGERKNGGENAVAVREEAAEQQSGKVAVDVKVGKEADKKDARGVGAENDEVNTKTDKDGEEVANDEIASREVADDEIVDGEVADTEDGRWVGAENDEVNKKSGHDIDETNVGKEADDKMVGRDEADTENAREAAQQHSEDIVDNEMVGEGEAIEQDAIGVGTENDDVNKTGGLVDETNARVAAEDEADNHVSSTTFDHGNLQQRESSNIPQQTEKLENVGSCDHVTSTSSDS